MTKPLECVTGAEAAQRALSSIGEPHGETGANGSLTTDAPRTVARLLQAEPEENDKAVLASLMSRHGCELSEVVERRYPKSGGYRREVVGYMVELSDDANLPVAISTLDSALSPADEETLTGWLAEMSVQCAFRQQSDFTGELTLRVYARNLSEYPADVVRKVLREWPTRSKWWPAWQELREELDRLTKPRRLMRTMLERKRDAERSSPASSSSPQSKDAA